MPSKPTIMCSKSTHNYLQLDIEGMELENNIENTEDKIQFSFEFQINCSSVRKMDCQLGSEKYCGESSIEVYRLKLIISDLKASMTYAMRFRKHSQMGDFENPERVDGLVSEWAELTCATTVGSKYGVGVGTFI